MCEMSEAQGTSHKYKSSVVRISRVQETGGGGGGGGAVTTVHHGSTEVRVDERSTIPRRDKCSSDI